LDAPSHHRSSEDSYEGFATWFDHKTSKTNNKEIDLAETQHATEIERIKKAYQRFDEEELYKTVWAPFEEKESTVRVQQMLVFSALMRDIGRLEMSGWDILDVGCGNGRILRSYIDYGADPHRLVGVDIIESSLNAGRRLSPHIKFEQGDGVRLNFPDAQFDLVTQYVVFSSIGSAALRVDLAKEMWRVLRIGGFIFWWDMLHMARDAGGDSEGLQFQALFPHINCREYQVCSSNLATPRRPTLLGSLLSIGTSATHVGALIGPKI
jgi:ubiquinone/menaquinone biosynthesis C-methylase UbiE